MCGASLIQHRNLCYISFVFVRGHFLSILLFGAHVFNRHRVQKTFTSSVSISFFRSTDETFRYVEIFTVFDFVCLERRFIFGIRFHGVQFRLIKPLINQNDNIKLTIDQTHGQTRRNGITLVLIRLHLELNKKNEIWYSDSHRHWRWTVIFSMSHRSCPFACYAIAHSLLECHEIWLKNFGFVYF